jgi:hypothetical protein
MKIHWIYIYLFASLAHVSALAQGTITFWNNNVIDPVTGLTYVAGIWADSEPGIEDDKTVNPYNTVGLVGAGTTPGGVTVGLFLASDLSTPLATTTLRTTTRPELFVGTQDVTIPGVPPNVPANLVIRAWSSTAGSYNAALTIPGAAYGEAVFTSKPLGGINPNAPPPSFPAPDLAPFPGLEMQIHGIPEPSTIAWGVLGLGALLVRPHK